MGGCFVLRLPIIYVYTLKSVERCTAGLNKIRLHGMYVWTIRYRYQIA